MLIRDLSKSPAALTTLAVALAFAVARPILFAAEGAKIPSSSGRPDFRAGSPAASHWAFKSPVRPVEPAVQNKSWVRNGIDRFVLARLEKEHLGPSPEIDRVTLVRRLSFDLTGLPPTPEDIEAFALDNSSDADEKLVERLLASPHYGERWGRHWLDAVGYADSNGYFDADTDRPLAYKYRDYVIKSINDDKPIDRFIQEQFAGDELAGFDPDGDVTPEMVEPLTATHLLRNAPDGTGESDGNPLEQKVDRYAVLEWNVQILGSAFLGLTLQCARCHDHKFEPVTQEEYYRLQAILRPAYDPEHWLKPNERAVTIAPRAVREENKRQTEQYEKELKALRESLEGVIAPFRKLALDENLAKLEEAARAEVRKALDTPEKMRTDEMKALLKKHEARLAIKEEDLVKRFADLATGYHALKDSLKKREAERPVRLPQIAALTERAGNPPRHRILVRGSHAREGQEVQPGVLAVLCSSNNSYERHLTTAGAQSSGRRLALARWLTSPENPVVVRVLVNRVWQRYFGRGLVATVDNFGVSGAKPSHPELLDFLAEEFVGSGWHMKSLHRLIVTSATYRQASRARDDAFAADPENRWLGRFPLKRLDAESLRDAMLSASGEIDPSVGGLYVPAETTAEGQLTVKEETAGARRRSVYLQQRRTKPVTLLDLFDGAQMNPNCAQRTVSTVPLQSLTLLNSEFARNRSKAFARRVIRESGSDSAQGIARAFQLTVGRSPKMPERNAAEAFLSAQRQSYEGKPDAEFAAWTDFCQTLFASSAFFYVE
ncbi:MAG: DUF1553 domain-containing protein [Verrucomicrobia bacterium]|nr:DUF1553 domain-containing protein [Verrucomicrobiota bacterium]